MVSIKNFKQMDLFHDGRPNYIKASPAICFANQWIGFNLIGTFITKELKPFVKILEIRQIRRRQQKPLELINTS